MIDTILLGALVLITIIECVVLAMSLNKMKTSTPRNRKKRNKIEEPNTQYQQAPIKRHRAQSYDYEIPLKEK